MALKSARPLHDVSGISKENHAKTPLILGEGR
jgi:hypothetical protein